jgi:hypothetical protein
VTIDLIASRAGRFRRPRRRVNAAPPRRSPPTRHRPRRTPVVQPAAACAATPRQCSCATFLSFLNFRSIDPHALGRGDSELHLIAADAINRAKSTDNEAIVAALEKTSLEVTTGIVKFGMKQGSYEYHQWMPPMLVVQWQDQKQVCMEQG